MEPRLNLNAIIVGQEPHMYSRIIDSLTDYPVKQVIIGLNWTAVVVEKNDAAQCGLASTLGRDQPDNQSTVPEPESLADHSALELASWIKSDILLRRSIGCAAINALLPRQPDRWIDMNAEDFIRTEGRGRKNVLVGHFPFAENLRAELKDFSVLEQHPRGEDLPVSAAPDLLPRADLVAITGMTFINHTLPDLLALIRPEAYVLLLGPSTPLTPIWADYGVDLLAGASVENIPAVLEAVAEGANFRQVHRAGVRLITQTLI